MSDWAIILSTKTRGEMCVTTNKSKAAQHPRCKEFVIVGVDELQAMVDAAGVTLGVFPGSQIIAMQPTVDAVTGEISDMASSLDSGNPKPDIKNPEPTHRHRDVGKESLAAIREALDMPDEDRRAAIKKIEQRGLFD